MRGRLFSVIVIVAGLIGAVLTLAGARSPLTGPLTLVFVLLVPAACVAPLLTGLDRLPRAIVAGTVSIVMTGSISETMLVTSSWSPRGGVIAVGAACAALAATAGVRRRPARTARRDATEPSTPDGDDDGDAWVFES